MFHATARTPFGLFRSFAAARVRRHHEAVSCGPPANTAGNTAPTEKEGNREPRGVRVCPASLAAPTRSVPRAPESRASGDSRRVPSEGARQGAPQARSSAHPAPGPPRVLTAPGLTFGALSPLAGCCGCGAAGGHREEKRDSEWWRPPAPPRLRPRPAPHRAWTEISPCRHRPWTHPLAELSGARPRFEAGAHGPRAKSDWWNLDPGRGSRATLGPATRDSGAGSGRAPSERARPRRGFNSGSRSAPRGRGP